MLLFLWGCGGLKSITEYDRAIKTLIYPQKIYGGFCYEKDAPEELVVPASWSEYTDLAAVFKDSFGYERKADPISIEVQDGTRFLSYGTDSDGDGVTDAYEIWLSETDPLTADSFPDPDHYLYLTDESGTTCYDRLLRREVFVTADDFTKTYQYEDYANPGRVSSAIIRYTDGTTKQLRYEYDGERLKSLYVGDNKYTITEANGTVRYLINDVCVKQISMSEYLQTIDHFDGTKEISRFDENGDQISYQNGRSFTMTYDELELLAGLTIDGSPYAGYTYDEYGNYLPVDATDHSIHYRYAYPLYQADYSFGTQNSKTATMQVNCKDDSYAHGDVLLLTDGLDGSSIPKTKDGEILSADADARTLRYQVGDVVHTVTYNARGYIYRDTAGDTTNTYTYDAYGNIKQVKTVRNGQESNHAYAYASAWSDQLISYDGSPIRYDAFGKPAEYYNGMAFAWAAGRLAQVTKDGLQASYRYDHRGLRDEKTINGHTTRYIYEGHDLIAELGDDPVYYTYDGDFNLAGFEWQGQRYYYQYDILGDVIGIVNENGAQLCSYSYDLWGKLTGITGDVTLAERNPFRYRGYFYDTESGFYYLETRYYDPEVKRFLSYDVLESFFYGSEEDTESLFVYCGNDPMFFCDATGEKAYVNTILPVSSENRFYTVANKIKSELNSYFSKKPSSSSTTEVWRFYSRQNFINNWNFLDSRDVVIIYCHGNDSAIGSSGDEITVSISDVNALKRKTFRLLILLACDCGHYGSRYSNIANAFAKKTDGRVIAASGSQVTDYPNFKADGGYYVYGRTIIYQDQNKVIYGNTLMEPVYLGKKLSVTGMIKSIGM